MRQPLLLLATSGLAREAAECVRAGGRYEVTGYLDDDPSLWGKDLDGVPVLGAIDEVSDYRNATLLVCAGRGSARSAIVDRLTTHGVTPDRFVTVVHPSVHVPTSCSVGNGSILLDGVTLTTAARIGKHVVAMPRVVLTHDDIVDDFTTLCAGVTLGGEVRIGRGAYIGMAASVRERVTIGGNAVVGMGSVVLADVPADQTWVGNPARVLNPKPSRQV